MRTIAEMKKQYPWQPGMGEISGMGGDYEEACRKMVYAGLAWLETRPDADLKATTYRNVYGILNADSPDAKELELVMPCYHPSYVLRNGSSGPIYNEFKQDLQLAINKTKERGSENE